MKKIFCLLSLIAASLIVNAQSAVAVTSSTEPIYTKATLMPAFSGDQGKYMAKNLKYPEDAKKMNITGQVWLSFVVEKDGSISNVKITKGIDMLPSIDSEAVRLVRAMPHFKAGTIDNKPVRVRLNTIIAFAPPAKK